MTQHNIQKLMKMAGVVDSYTISRNSQVEQDPEEQLTDFLTDFLMLADSNDVDIDKLFIRAKEHMKAETQNG